MESLKTLESETNSLKESIDIPESKVTFNKDRSIGFDSMYKGNKKNYHPKENESQSMNITEMKKSADELKLLEDKLTKRFSSKIGTINLDNLIQVCTNKLKAENENRKALFIRASTYLKKGFFYDSLEDCNRLISIDSTYAGAYYIRGCSYEKLENLNQAIQDYTKVIELDDTHVNAVFARGACYNKLVTPKL